jgi:S1-C subfamily serine protease
VFQKSLKGDDDFPDAKDVDIYEVANLDKQEILVRKVIRVLGGTSEQLKLEVNDIITQIEGKKINSTEEFLDLFLKLKVDQTIQVRIIRNEKELNLS